MRALLYLLSCFLLLSSGPAVMAQPAADTAFLRAVVTDTALQEPVSDAGIRIRDQQETVVYAAFTAGDGSFSLPKLPDGHYTLEVVQIGYNNLLYPLQLNGGKALRWPEQFILPADQRQLKAVQVVSRRKLVEQKPGMLVYHAEHDISNSGATAADVLRKAPVLSVDAQGNVSMRGSSNLKILVNGKYSGQMARSAADALNMMPAAMIKSVEVITTPSAKYDAEGAAGVINIITKKGSGQFSGAIEAVAGNWEQAINPRLSSSSGKWTMQLNGHLHRRQEKTGMQLERVNLENDRQVLRLNQDQLKNNVAPHGSGDLSVSYTPDSLNEISFSVHSWFGNWPDNNQLSSQLRNESGILTERYNQDVSSRAAYLGADINLAYTRKCRRPGQELTLMAQGAPSRDDSRYSTLQWQPDGTLRYHEQNNGKTRNMEWTAQADYILPMGRKGLYTLESGAKLISRSAGNRYAVVAGNTPDPELLTPQADRTDYFHYTQQVWAAYGLMKMNLARGWYAEAGARLEATRIVGRQEQSGSQFNNQFSNLIPTATLSRKISEHQSLNLSYTQRLTRPYVWDLNPNANASDPKNISSGNPELEPELAHQAELAYSTQNRSGAFFNGSLFWRQTDHAIVDYTTTDLAGISLTRKQNLAANRSYGLNLAVSCPLLQKWQLNLNANVNYLDFSSAALRILHTGWAVNGTIHTSYRLKRQYTLQFSGAYDSRKVSLQGYESSWYYYSMALRKAFPGIKVNATLALTNPFNRTIQQRIELNAPGFRTITDNSYYNRAVKLTVNWEFGYTRTPREHKSISNDDVKGRNKG